MRLVTLILSCLLSAGVLSAQTKRAAPKKMQVEKYMEGANQNALRDALQLYRAGQYQAAAIKLFPLSRRPDFKTQRFLIKKTLGDSLMKLGFYQVAAWQYVDIVRSGDNPGLLRESLEQLSIAADQLGDDTILNYAVSKMKIDDFPEKHKDMLLFRMGEIKQKAGDFSAAVSAYSRVSSGSRYSYSARYNLGLAQAEMGKGSSAIDTFTSLLSSLKRREPTDDIKVSTQMALARTYYQNQKWNESLDYYRQIPRDHELWHDALFESSWANLRAAKFRSALSNFHSLHSSYYEDYFFPESLLLRAILYLYICKEDEVQKVLSLFDESYGPVGKKITEFLKTTRDPLTYFNEIEKALEVRKAKKIGDDELVKDFSANLPYRVLRHVIQRSDIKNSLEYLRKLYAEQNTVRNLGPAFSQSLLGKYANRILSNRVKNTKVVVAEQMKAHLIKMRAELKDLNEQAGFLRYEMISSERERLKKRVANKDKAEAAPAMDEDKSRDFYVKNGYEYWAFKGEFWLDEIGNYFYLGKSQCNEQL